MAAGLRKAVRGLSVYALPHKSSTRARRLLYSGFRCTRLRPPAFEQCPAFRGCAPTGPLRPLIGAHMNDPSNTSRFGTRSRAARSEGGVQRRPSTTRIPAASAAPEHVMRHTAAQPSCRARSRVLSLTSSAIATTGIPRTRPASESAAADMLVTITAGLSRFGRSPAPSTTMSKPQAASSYAKRARTSSSSIASRTSGRTARGRGRRSSMLSAYGSRQPMTRTHTPAAADMSVWFPTEGSQVLADGNMVEIATIERDGKVQGRLVLCHSRCRNASEA
jgi:hypothetical protein